VAPPKQQAGVENSMIEICQKNTIFAHGYLIFFAYTKITQKG